MTQKELTDRLDLASRQYYNGLTSEFSDTEFDLKLKELQKMEAERTSEDGGRKWYRIAQFSNS